MVEPTVDIRQKWWLLCPDGTPVAKCKKIFNSITNEGLLGVNFDANTNERKESEEYDF